MLEKILEEIAKKVFCVETREYESDTVVLFDDVEEILREHMNEGWIPVEERLPTKEECEKDNNVFIVQSDTGERFSCEYDPLSNGYDNPLWCCNIPVIAWQTLPEPYRPDRKEK